ncbi:MAG: BON domain-containing protein [Rubrivivax sp.]
MITHRHLHSPPRTPAPAPAPPAHPDAALRPGRFSPPRRRWPGVLAAAAVGGAVAAAIVSSYYDSRSLGERLDAGIQATESGVRQQVDGLRQGAAAAAARGEAATQALAVTLSDTGITAAVKTALAADPGLSALRIEVDTHDGVVTLSGPAPDAKARERAAVIAAAPQGVKRVDNHLSVAAAIGERPPN